MYTCQLAVEMEKKQSINRKLNLIEDFWTDPITYNIITFLPPPMFISPVFFVYVEKATLQK